MSWRVKTPPQSEPLSPEEVKAHLRVETADEDALIDGLIAAARQHVELGCNRAVMPQTWEGTFPDFRSVRLAGGNVRSIDSIAYYDPNDVEQTLAESDYRAILSEPAKIAPADSWPATGDRIDAVTVTLSVGYSEDDGIPAAIKQAMLILIGGWYENREAVATGTIATEIPMGANALLFPYRVLYP